MLDKLTDWWYDFKFWWLFLPDNVVITGLVSVVVLAIVLVLYL